MCRVELSTEEERAIEATLPDLIPLQRSVSQLSPELLSMAFPAESRVPEAAVCLREAVDVATEARYAALEAAIRRVYYEQKRVPPQPMSAVFFAKFYLDDAALRLYAAGEHLANAIAHMLDLSEEELQAYRGDKVSRQVAVGKLLNDRLSETEVGTAISNLGPAWFKTMQYRNRWVHDQPPLLAGQGIQFRRGNRWRGQPGGPRTLAINGGDEAELTIEVLSDIVVNALRQFSEALHEIVAQYLQVLRAKDVRLEGSSLLIRVD